MSSTVAPYRSEPALVVLHALRIAGRVAAAELATVTGLPDAVVAHELSRASTAGDVAHRDGIASGWTLTDQGRERHRDLLTDERTRADRDAEIRSSYTTLLSLNGWFKTLCTEWQLDGHPPSCIRRLADRHGEVLAITDQLAGTLSRFASYGPRFDDALTRLRAGDDNAFTRPLTGSYHDVWMHLHEDLLLTLDRRRSRADEA